MAGIVEQLGITPEMRGQVSGEPQGLGVSGLREQQGGDDFIVVFLRAREELEQLAHKLVNSLGEGGLLWICFPQPADEEVTNLAVKTDLAPDQDWQALAELGYGPVQQEVLHGNEGRWIAMRFAPQPSRH